MEYNYYKIGHKEIRIAYKSRAFGKTFYSIGLASKFNDTEASISDDGYIHASFPEDYGLTSKECADAIAMMQVDEKKKADAYMLKLNINEHEFAQKLEV